MFPRRTPANVVGPQVRALRLAQGLTQGQLAARCQLAGLELSRGTYSHVEARLRCVTDEELFLLATVFKVALEELYPPDWKRLTAAQKFPVGRKRR